MSKSVSTSTDKIIVDRSKKHRNKAVFDTVKTTRERLQQGAGASDAYEREMLTMHIAETLQGLPQAQPPVHGIFAAVPYCLDLIGGPYVVTNDTVCKAFRPKSAQRPVQA